MSWAELFERAAAFAVTEDEIRDRLAQRREAPDGTGDDPDGPAEGPP